MTRRHDAALLARIREIPALSEYVFDGEVLGRPQRYVLVHSNRGVGSADRLAQPVTADTARRRKSYWVHSVGASKDQADAVAEKVIAQLLGWLPALDGWQCERVTHEASEPVQKDDSRQPVLYYGVDQFDFFTSPIPVSPTTGA